MWNKETAYLKTESDKPALRLQIPDDLKEDSNDLFPYEKDFDEYMFDRHEGDAGKPLQSHI